MKKRIRFWIGLFLLPPLLLVGCGLMGGEQPNDNGDTSAESRMDNDELQEEVAELRAEVKKLRRESRSTSFSELLFYFSSALALWVIVWAVGAYLLWTLLWSHVDAKKMNLRMKILLGPIYLILARANLEGRDAISNKKMREIVEKINRLENARPQGDAPLAEVPPGTPHPQLVEQVAKLEDKVFALENTEALAALNTQMGKLQEGVKNGGGRLISLENGIKKLKEDLAGVAAQQLSHEELEDRMGDIILFFLKDFKKDLKDDYLTRQEWVNIPKGGGTNISRSEMRETIAAQISAQSRGLNKREIEKIIEDTLLKQSIDSPPTQGGIGEEGIRALILAELSRLPQGINRVEVEGIVKEILENKDHPPQQGTPPPKDETPPPQTQTEEEDAFYTPAPHNGVFYKKRMSREFKPLETMYKIVQVSSSEAVYTLVDDPATLQKAFSVRNTYVSPAMRIENPDHVNLAEYNRLRITFGRLARVNDNWKILEKGVVKVS